VDTADAFRPKSLVELIGLKRIYASAKLENSVASPGVSSPRATAVTIAEMPSLASPAEANNNMLTSERRRSDWQGRISAESS
jgi:hypothetical protein